MKSYKKVLSEGMLEQLAGKMAQTNGMGSNPEFDMSPYLNRPGGVFGDGNVTHMSPDRASSIKTGNIGFNEVEALQKLKNVKGVPDLLNTSVEDGVFSPDGQPNPNMFNGQMSTSAIPGMEIGDIGGALNKDLQNTAKNGLWKLRKQIHQNGIANNNMGPDNVKVNPDNGDVGMPDFSGAEIGYGPAFFEALGSDKTDPMSGAGDMPFQSALEALGGAGGDPNMGIFKGNKEKLIKDFLKRNKSNPMGLPLDEKGLQGLLGGGTHLDDGENQTPMAQKFKKLLDNFGFGDEDFKGFINMLYNGVGEEMIDSTKKKAKPNKSFRHPPIKKKRVASDD